MIELPGDERAAVEKLQRLLDLADAGVGQAALDVDPGARPVIGRRRRRATASAPGSWRSGRTAPSGPRISLRRRIASAVQRTTSTTLTGQNCGCMHDAALLDCCAVVELPCATPIVSGKSPGVACRWLTPQGATTRASCVLGRGARVELHAQHPPRVLQEQRARAVELLERLVGLPPVVEGLAEHRVVADRVDPADLPVGSERLDGAGAGAVERALRVAVLAAVELLDAGVIGLRGNRVAELGAAPPAPTIAPESPTAATSARAAARRQHACACIVSLLRKRLRRTADDGRDMPPARTLAHSTSLLARRRFSPQLRAERADSAAPNARRRRRALASRRGRVDSRRFLRRL